jgi:endoglucanase
VKTFNSEITAADLVKSIRVGWNLGNTLDTVNFRFNYTSISDFEQAWRNPLTTKENIDTIKNAGFNAIRIPVSWAKCVDSNYSIREDWMNRVEEIAGYAVSNDMIIIINTHHDEIIFKYMDSEMPESKKAFRKIWEQIADRFKNYDEYLLFESLNEPRTVKSQMEWKGGTPEEHANLNDMNQLFVDTVRASGGNNAFRVLLIPGYAASIRQFVMNALTIPHDTAKNKIIVSIHMYEPNPFALDVKNPENTWDGKKDTDTMPVTDPIDRAYDTFVSKGIPVIIGELGAVDKENQEKRARWVEFNVSYAKSRGIPCFWWDDGGHVKLLDRRNNIFFFPEILKGIMRGVQ